MKPLFTADTHTTQNGTTFYSSWAGTGDTADMQAKYNANQQALKEYEGQWQYVPDDYKPTGHETKLLLTGIKENEMQRSARIVANPEHLTPAEIALILDNGNLCFGFNYLTAYHRDIITAYMD